MYKELLNQKKNTKAVVLLSGGMDSTTLLFYCLRIHKEVHAVIIDYNQRHKKEIDHAIRIAKKANVSITLVNIQLPSFEGSPLVDANTSVPAQQENKQAVTVVPLRNTFFILHACAVATSIRAQDVYLGAVEDDQLSYPDCRPVFFDAFQKLLISQNSEIKINYPFVQFKKDKVVALGQELGVPWDLTWTCYQGKEKACGQCDACKERLHAFQVNDLPDPIEYQKS